MPTYSKKNLSEAIGSSAIALDAVGYSDVLDVQTFATVAGTHRPYYMEDRVTDANNNVILIAGGHSSAVVDGQNVSAIYEYDTSTESVVTEFNNNFVSSVTASNAIIHHFRQLPDGKIYIGGDFNTPVATVNFAKLNSNGTFDTSFTSNTNNDVYWIDVDSNEKVLVAGNFTTVKGVSRSRIARAHPNGDVDTTFTASANGAVKFVHSKADGKVVIAGDFTSVSATAVGGIAQLHSNGSVDTSWNTSSNVSTTFLGAKTIALAVDENNFFFHGQYAPLKNKPYEIPDTSLLLDSSGDPEPGFSLDQRLSYPSRYITFSFSAFQMSSQILESSVLTQYYHGANDGSRRLVNIYRTGEMGEEFSNVTFGNFVFCVRKLNNGRAYATGYFTNIVKNGNTVSVPGIVELQRDSAPELVHVASNSVEEVHLFASSSSSLSSQQQTIDIYVDSLASPVLTKTIDCNSGYVDVGVVNLASGQKVYVRPSYSTTEQATVSGYVYTQEVV